MFTDLGMAFDNKIEDIKGWNRERSWYKFYIYLQLLASEKNLDFNRQVEISNNVGHLYPRHYKKLKKYKKPIVTPYVSNNMTIADPETGAMVELKEIPTVTMATDNESGYKSFAFPREASFSGKANISAKALEMLIGKRFVCSGSLKEIQNKMQKELPPGTRIYNVSLTQNRIHKRYRINKKWAKRYGYVCVVYYE